jgi:predicted PurR-regulated permease PerM
VEKDTIAVFFASKTPRRMLAVFSFVVVLVLFRKLFALLIFAVAFHLLLSTMAGFLCRRFRMRRSVAMGLVVVTLTGLLSSVLWVSSARVLVFLTAVRAQWPDRMEALKESPLFLSISEYVPDTERLAESAQHYLSDVAKAASTIGHWLVYLVIGLILAIIYFVEEPEIEALRQTLNPQLLLGTLLRWAGYVLEAVGLLIQLQLVVAAVNATLTLPILLILGFPKIPLLMLLIFVSGLIPVVGNVISGAVLSLLAFQVKGLGGVALFLVLTFVLHKIESYFLNPRLASKHVQLPGFLLVLSLIACEHLFGLAGLFVSFPLLFVARKIRDEFAQEDTASEPPSASAEL